MKLKKPPKPICALCALDDDVTSAHLGDGVWQHTCTGSKHPEPRVWIEAPEGGVDDLALEGVTAEWGLYDDLPKCLVHGEPYVEYGVLEYRYAQLNPSRYAFLVDRYGHTARAPTRYSASSFTASALFRLWQRGDLDRVWGDATGRWSYNSSVSYWRLPTVDGTDERITWADFAAANGLDPEAWPWAR